MPVNDRLAIPSPPSRYGSVMRDGVVPVLFETAPPMITSLLGELLGTYFAADGIRQSNRALAMRLSTIAATRSVVRLNLERYGF
jgi:hypothetical protein